MAGNLKSNILLGLVASVLTFCFSYHSNTLVTSLFRSGIGFLAFFVFGFIIRMIIGSMRNTDQIEKQTERRETAPKINEDNVEEKIQMVDSSFQSISLHSLHQMDEESDPGK